MGVNAQYRVKAFAHDFGSYREVCVQYDADDAAATDFAYGLEANTPTHWDEIAIAELLWFENRALYAQKLAKGDIDDLDVPEIYRTAAPPEDITLEALIPVTTVGRPVESERVAARVCMSFLAVPGSVQLENLGQSAATFNSRPLSRRRSEFRCQSSPSSRATD